MRAINLPMSRHFTLIPALALTLLPFASSFAAIDTNALTIREDADRRCVITFNATKHKEPLAIRFTHSGYLSGTLFALNNIGIYFDRNNIVKFINYDSFKRSYDNAVARKVKSPNLKETIIEGMAPIKKLKISSGDDVYIVIRTIDQSELNTTAVPGTSYTTQAYVIINNVLAYSYQGSPAFGSRIPVNQLEFFDKIPNEAIRFAEQNFTIIGPMPMENFKTLLTEAIGNI